MQISSNLWMEWMDLMEVNRAECSGAWVMMSSLIVWKDDFFSDKLPET